MEDDHVQELRFVCKLCNKKYPCGKSLGGHMRSHVVSNSNSSPESDVDRPPDAFGFGQSFYGLRENPRKTWRADAATTTTTVMNPSPSVHDRVCKQCGKGFQSLKALCGHMASHSDKEKAGLKDNQYSWTSENPKMVLDSHSDMEEGEEDQPRSPFLSKPKKCDKIVVPNNGSSSVSEVDGEEQEEGAICLMLLSRDTGNNNKGVVNSTVDSSDNNSVILETKSSSIELKEKKIEEEIDRKANSDSGYFLDECGKAESDVSVDGFPRHGSFSKPLARTYVSDATLDECGNHKRSKYECYNCKKSFKSYQALGGHRPCHKRPNNNQAYYESRYDSGDDDEDSTEFIATGSKTAINRKPSGKNKAAKKNKGHVCPFCDRVFKNGQALGGHKRSHFIGGHEMNNNNPNNNRRPTKPDMLDLNLPAPEDDDNDGRNRLSPW